jgi:hypothetical protein
VRFHIHSLADAVETIVDPIGMVVEAPSLVVGGTADNYRVFDGLV